MTALIALLDRTQTDSVLARTGCYLALVVIVLGVLKVVFGSCQSNAARV